ncbi:MAG TPA: hypothetical protein VFG51_00965 [Candidatus Saccharimonadia bacterium]|nr:hypothetical protein [Candidatus Saccharimonadia bacterium]
MAISPQEKSQSPIEFTVGSTVRLRDLLETYPKAKFTYRGVDERKPEQCYVHPENQSARDAIEKYYGKAFSDAGLLIDKTQLVAIDGTQNA